MKLNYFHFMRILYLTFVFFICESSLLAQISQPYRYEAEVAQFGKDYYVISAKENGLYLMQELDEITDDNKFKWEVTRLDTALQEVSKTEVLIHKDFTFKGYSYDNGKFVMLFQEGSDYAKDLLFIKFSIEEENYKTYRYKNLVPLIISEFELKNDAAVFGGRANSRTVVMIYNFSEKKGIVLPGFYNERSSLLQIVTETDDQWIRTITSDLLPNKRYGISVKAYSTMGEQIFSEELKAENDYSLTDGRVVNSSQGGNLLAGTYSIKRRTATSRGIYVADLHDTEENQVNLYNYAEFENFFNYMKENRKERVLKKIARKKVKGQKLKFTYRLFVQDIIKQNNENILIGEAYHPTYSTNTYSHGFFDYSFDPMLQGRSSQSFNGYKYTHAVIIAFDDNGKLLWDNSFEINDLHSFQLEEHVQLAFIDEKIVMLYLFRQQLKVKVIENNEIIEGKFSEDLRILYDSDEMKSNDQQLEGLERWYGNNFYAYGVNKVKNLEKQNIKLNRKVFFINKIVVE